MFKRISLFFLLLIVGVIAKDIKIGYIDSERIYQEFQETTIAKTSLEKEVTKYKFTADSLKARLDSAQAEYESQKLMLSEIGRATKETEIEQLRREYTQYLESVWGKGGKIEQKNRELITPIVTKINEAVNKIAKEEGFTMVLDATEAKIVYADAGLDLTDMVLEELNKEFKPIEAEVGYRKFLVLSFFEATTEAQQEKLGDMARNSAYNLVKAQSKIEIVTNTNVEKAMQSRNLINGAKIEDKDIFDIGRELQADYVISGKVSKQGKRIDLEVSLSDPKQQVTIGTEKGEASMIQDLSATLGELIQKLFKKIEK